VFIGFDSREDLAVQVLAHSIQSRASRPVRIGQVRLSQLGPVFSRPRDPQQSMDFSFSRFLVPWLCDYRGWALFLDADMLCLGDIAELWDLRDPRDAVQVVKHEHRCVPGRKFQGEPQTPYARKNWSSVMLFQCARCRALTPERVNTASGLHLHQFAWLEEGEIGALPPRWNVLVGVQDIPEDARLLHYTLGGPWFEDCRDMACADLWWRGRQALNHPLPVA
jgi:lipopolysaccharide biosynthesis glycosyltransferase